MPERSKKLSKVADQNTPDEVLIEATRSGNRSAFAELWRRHYRSGITVAHSFTNLDADDLVSEAFARIYKRTIEGGGPKGAFRPYLYTTIRNLASTWGSASSKVVQVDDLEVLEVAEPTESADEPFARSLDNEMTVTAYRSLPTRWQTVLWYTEVEGLDPHEVAPILGMTANSVAALSYRAREGLRKAWLQAHVTDATASGPCAWVIDRLGEHSRNSLTDRESAKLEAHLTICPKCSNVCDEVDEVGSRLAMVMLPLLLGSVAAGTLLSSAAAGAGSSVAAAGLGAGVASTTVPALPAGIGVAATTGGAAASVTTVVAVAASGVVVAAAGITGAVGLAESSDAGTIDTAAANSQEGTLADPLGIDTDTGAEASVDSIETLEPGPADPTHIPTDTSTTSTPVPVVPEKATDDSTDESDDTTDDTVDQPTDTTPSKSPTDTAAPKTPKAPTTTAPTTAPAPDSASTATDSSGKNLVDSTTGLVDNTTKTVTGTVDSTVGAVNGVVNGVTGTVDGVVDGLLPEGDGIVGSLNGTVDSVTGTVNGVTNGLTGTVDGVTNVVDGVVGGVTGGLGKLLGRK